MVYLKEFQSEISGGRENLDIFYNPSVKENFNDREKVLQYINEHTKKEIDAGFCLVGPHRDDFSLFINGKDLKHYGSQGQIRTSVLSLKLSECEVTGEICGEYPVLLFDDITSEIDIKRRGFLFEKICCYTGRQDDEPVEEILFAVWSRPVFFIIFSIMSPLSIPIGCIADQK